MLRSVPNEERSSTATDDLPRIRPRRTDRRWLQVVLVLIAVIVLADALVGEQSMSSGRRARQAYNSADSDLVALREQNLHLRDQIRRLREDPETIEFVARKDLGLARRGEILVVVK